MQIENHHHGCLSMDGDYAPLDEVNKLAEELEQWFLSMIVMGKVSLAKVVEWIGIINLKARLTSKSVRSQKHFAPRRNPRWNRNDTNACIESLTIPLLSGSQLCVAAAQKVGLKCSWKNRTPCKTMGEHQLLAKNCNSRI